LSVKKKVVKKSVTKAKLKVSSKPAKKNKPLAKKTKKKK